MMKNKGNKGYLAVIALGGLTWWALSRKRDPNSSEGEITPGEPGSFNCPYCDEVFESQDELTAHIYHYHPGEISEDGNEFEIPDDSAAEEYICPYCGEVFYSEAERNLHINYEHPDVEPGDPAGPESLIVYSNLRCTPKNMYLGETATIRVDVTQMGTQAETVEVYLGPDTGLSETTTLEPGQTRTLTWQYTPPEAGSYAISAGDSSLVFGVTVPSEPPTDPDQTAMAYHIPAGIVWTMRHTSSGLEWGVAPEHAHWIKHSGGWRTANLDNVFDYWADGDINLTNPGNVYRDLISGSLMWSGKLEVYEPGSMNWFNTIAKLRYLDDGCPEGWRHDGIWNQYRPLCVSYPGEPGTGGSSSWMCGYFPPHPGA